MNKSTLWALCLVNMAISGVAVYFVVKPKPAHGGFPAASPTEVAPVARTEVGDWKSELDQASDLQRVKAVLAMAPDDETTRRWLKEHITSGLVNERIDTDAFFMDRLLAQITRQGQLVIYGDDEDTSWLKGIVTDTSLPILVRTVALQASADAASRRTKTDVAGWQADWRGFLDVLVRDTSGTSLQGQALHLMHTSQHQKLADWSTDEWNAMIADILKPASTSDESSKIIALNLAFPRTSSESVWSSIRQLAQTSASEILQANAIAALAQNGSPEDIRWLNSYPAKSVKISQAIWAARARVNSPVREK